MRDTSPDERPVPAGSRRRLLAVLSSLGLLGAGVAALLQQLPAPD